MLLAVLDRLQEKPKGLLVVDTHAGGGRYDLASPFAGKNREWEGGIARLPPPGEAPRLVDRLVEAVAAANPEGGLRWYPGSPWLVRARLRPVDRLHAYELHGNEAAALEREISGPGVRVVQGDGFTALEGELPPRDRRGLVLVDPPYELPEDYDRVVEVLGAGLRRCATGVFLIWYPCLARPEARALPGRLVAEAGPRWLVAELHVDARPETGRGMRGSGVLVANPPVTLQPSLREALPWLAERLAIGPGAGYRLDSRLP